MTTPPPTMNLIRSAVEQALAEHAPADKRYDDDGTVLAKVCRCGVESPGPGMTARSQHLADVATAAVLMALGGEAADQ